VPGGAGVAEPHGSVAPDSFAALRNPHVRALALGQMASAVGVQFISLAVGWELYERTGDAWALGLVGLFEVAPVFFLMLPAGHAADRFARRNVGMAAYGLLALAALGMAFVSWAQAPLEFVYALLVVIGGARAFASPSIETLTPQIVDRRLLANAQAWIVSCWEFAAVGGPAIAGLLIAYFGTATWVYLIAAACEVVFVLTLMTLPAIRPTPSGEPPRMRDVFAGLGFIRRNPIYLAAITLDLFGVLFGGAIALLPIFAKDILEIGPTGLGILRAAPAVGALSAALLVAHRPPFQQPGKVLLWVVAGFGLATIGFGLSRSVEVSLVCLFLTGAFDSVSMVIRATLLPMITPDRLRGRVAAVEHMFIGFSNELGAFESGAVAALIGPIFSVVSGGVATLIVVAMVAVTWPALARIGPLHTLRPLDSEPESLPEPSRQSVQP
jgi:MFS family permease